MGKDHEGKLAFCKVWWEVHHVILQNYMIKESCDLINFNYLLVCPMKDSRCWSHISTRTINENYTKNLDTVVVEM